MKYSYKVYELFDGKRRFIMEISANSPSEAVRKAHLDNWHWVKTRTGNGHTNTAILVYTVWCEGRDKESADFLMVRQF